MVQAANDLDSVHKRCQTGVSTVIEGLGLTEIEDNNVVEEMLPNERNAVFPCCMVTMEGDPETVDEENSFETDSTMYPVQVLICDHASARDTDRIAAYTAWRRELIRHFRSLVVLPGVPEAYNIAVRPKVVFDPEQGPKYQYVKTGFTVLCYCEEPRRGREPEGAFE